MTVDVESALFRRDVQRHQGDRDVDVEEHAAFQAVHVIVPFHTAVVPACLIGKVEVPEGVKRAQRVDAMIGG